MEIITGTFFFFFNKYQFTLNNFHVKVTETNSLYMDDFKDIDQIESIKGITSDGRDILLIQCSFIKNIIFCNSFNIQCFILSNSLIPFDFMIDRITFYSPAINTFFSPKYARQIVDNKDISPEYINHNTKGYFKKFNKYFDTQKQLLEKYNIPNPIDNYFSK